MAYNSYILIIDKQWLYSLCLVSRWINFIFMYILGKKKITSSAEGKRCLKLLQQISNIWKKSKPWTYFLEEIISSTLKSFYRMKGNSLFLLKIYVINKCQMLFKCFCAFLNIRLKYIKSISCSEKRIALHELA